ncbi:hypothetical protein BKA56DRAFT_622047 [Ilyonectria sp. MPI-CAGE-AT-0026]|nr:hypothetical protein BKA56DRAFT_622047 [Ilyonectria sp. MPI-CAGE-AT-0026]
MSAVGPSTSRLPDCTVMNSTQEVITDSGSVITLKRPRKQSLTTTDIAGCPKRLRIDSQYTPRSFPYECCPALKSEYFKESEDCDGRGFEDSEESDGRDSDESGDSDKSEDSDESEGSEDTEHSGCSEDCETCREASQSESTVFPLNSSMANPCRTHNASTTPRYTSRIIDVCGIYQPYDAVGHRIDICITALDHNSKYHYIGVLLS